MISIHNKVPDEVENSDDEKNRNNALNSIIDIIRGIRNNAVRVGENRIINLSKNRWDNFNHIKVDF